MEWKEISKRIEKEIHVGTKIPKTDGTSREITNIDKDKIQMKVGISTPAKKYTTKQMIAFAFETINSNKMFTSRALKARFPKEYKQGPCIFSMTGGILEYLDIARCVPNPKGRGYAYISKTRDK